MRCHGIIGCLAEGGAERRADLDDRPLAADRGAAADGERRGQRFYRRDHRTDDAFLVIDRVEHLGHAVAARLRREIGDQEDHDQPADHRHQDDPWPQGLGGVN